MKHERAAEAFVDGLPDRQGSIDLPKKVVQLTLTTSPTQERHREKVRDLMRAAHEKSVFGDIPFSLDTQLKGMRLAILFVPQAVTNGLGNQLNGIGHKGDRRGLM